MMIIIKGIPLKQNTNDKMVIKNTHLHGYSY